MAVPFGFSVGDFIATISLITDIISALRSADGAVVDYSNLMTELGSLEKAFSAIQACNLEPSSPGYPAATQVVADCQQFISRFLEQVSKYQVLLAGGSSLRDQIRKIKWSNCRQKDVDKLRSRLHTLTSALSLLMMAIHLERGNATKARLDEKLSELQNAVKEKEDGQSQLIQKIEDLLANTDSLSQGREVSYEVRPLRLIGAPIAPDFVGRPQVMRMIEKEMLPISAERQTIAVLHGMGGTGKSQIARRYAELHQSDYSAIFWINATTEHSTKLSIAKLAELIPLPNVLNPSKEISRNQDGIADALRAVNEWLCSKGNGKWLLIFDDVPWTEGNDEGYSGPGENRLTAEDAFDAYKYVPKVSQGSILATSRLSSVAYAFGAVSIYIDAMLEDESVQLLRKACRRSREDAGEYLTALHCLHLAYDISLEIRVLAARLGMHPLALSQAGRYLLETGSSVSKYLEKYDARFKVLLRRRPLAREYQNGSIDATLSLSFDSLAARKPSAAALLMLWSCFDKSNIFFLLFGWLSQLKTSGHIMSISPSSPINPPPNINALPPLWLEQICADEDTWLACISALQDFSFIRQNEREDSISLHPLIHEWSIHFCEVSWMNDSLAAAANVLGAALLAIKDRRVGVAPSSLRPHIDHWYLMLSLRSSQPPCQLGADTAAIFEIAHFYRKQGFFDRYRVLSGEILNTFTRRLGSTDRKTLELRADMYSILMEEARWEEAIQAALSLREQIPEIRWWPWLTMKENSAFVLSYLAWHLSIACCEVGKIGPMEELLEDVENIQDDPEVLRVRPCLVFTHLWLEERIAPFRRKDVQAPTHDLSALMQAESKYLDLLDDAALWPSPQGRQQQMTKGHLLRLLGEQYFEQRDLARAKACLVRSLDIFKEIDGPAGRTTLGLAGTLVSHGLALHSSTALRIPNWHKSIIGVLQRIENEKKQPEGTRSQSPNPRLLQKHGSTALGHMRWSEAMSAMREIVRERPTKP